MNPHRNTRTHNRTPEVASVWETTARTPIMEDEEKMARMLARVMREEGYVAEVVADGRSGRGPALDDSLNLLVVDRTLPKRGLTGPRGFIHLVPTRRGCRQEPAAPWSVP